MSVEYEAMRAQMTGGAAVAIPRGLAILILGEDWPRGERAHRSNRW